MTTEMISISEYRKNISLLTDRASKTNTSFIITSHGKAIWEYRPLGEKDIVVRSKYSQTFIDELAEMERDYENGKFSGPFTKEESRSYLNTLS